MKVKVTIETSEKVENYIFEATNELDAIMKFNLTLASEIGNKEEILEKFKMEIEK